MREYLFELRKKANKTQKEIDKYVFDKYGFKMQYIGVELGRLWKDLSGNRAKMLADALETTPEYILQCEAEQGGYERYSMVSQYDNPHKVKGGRCAEYDEPLTDEEKALVEEYLPYVNKVIDRLQYGKYKNCLNVLMTAEDFYDIGILAFIRSIKHLSMQKNKDPEFLDKIDELVPFYRFNFSRAIKSAYMKYIRGANTAKRKASINALALDSEVRDGETDENFYNFVPSKDLPIPITAESTWNLDMLYSYLNENQIQVCKMLISDWTTGMVIKYGYASQRDIGIIRFYLEQFKVYGKILWRAEDYKSDTPNIHFSFTSLRWKFAVSYKKKTYSMGTYKDLADALDLQLIAHSHIIAGDFLQWHNAHLMPNAANVKVFTYPLSCDENIDFESLPPLSEKPKVDKTITRATKENPVGIFADKRKDFYDVRLGVKYKLGLCKTFEEALKLRRLAEDHYIAGDIDAWYAEFKKGKEKTTYARLEPYKEASSEEYDVVCSRKGKVIRLGIYSKEKALEVKALADSHIDAGDFDKWSEKFYADYLKERASKPSYARVDKIVVNGSDKYIVRGSYLKKPYRLGTYSYEDAVKVKTLADNHIDTGDFIEWSEKFYAEYKKTNPRKRTTDKVVYARVDKYLKHGKNTYEVVRCYDKKRTRLGCYASEENAISVKKLADAHVDAGDFDEWAKGYYEKYKSDVKAHRSEAMRKLAERPVLATVLSDAYVLCRYKVPNYVLLCYDGSGSEKSIYETLDVEEAYKTMDLANAHIEAGDFDVWIADYKKS